MCLLRSMHIRVLSTLKWVTEFFYIESQIFSSIHVYEFWRERNSPPIRTWGIAQSKMIHPAVSFRTQSNSKAHKTPSIRFSSFFLPALRRDNPTFQNCSQLIKSIPIFLSALNSGYNNVLNRHGRNIWNRWIFHHAFERNIVKLSTKCEYFEKNYSKTPMMREQSLSYAIAKGNLIGIDLHHRYKIVPT